MPVSQYLEKDSQTESNSSDSDSSSNDSNSNLSSSESLRKNVKKTLNETKENNTVNPFFIDPLKKDLEGVELSGLLQTYKSLYIICLKDSKQSIPKEFFQKTVSGKLFDEFSKYFDIIKGNIRLLDNANQRKYVKIISYKIIKNFIKIDNTKDEDKLLVAILLNFRGSTIMDYNNVYHANTDIRRMNNIKMVIDYFGNNSNPQIRENFRAMIYGKEYVDYWTRKKNCDLTVSYCFDLRRFNSADRIKQRKDSLIQVDKKKLEMNKLMDELDNKFNEPNSYDPAPVMYRNTAFIDLGRAIFKKKTDETTGEQTNITSYYPENIELKERTQKIKEFMASFKKASSEQEKYDLIFSVLMNQRESYMFMNNKEAFENPIINKIIRKNIGIFAYVFSRAFICMLLEESFRKSFMVSTDMCVLDIDIANLYPVFPNCSEQPNMNPYNFFPLSKDQLNSLSNTQGLKMIKSSKDHGVEYGVTDIKTFKLRLNMFVSGKEDFDVFEGMNWEDIGFTGSFLQSCLPKKSPLQLSLNSKDTDDGLLSDAVNGKYFAKSDLDIMIYAKTLKEFIDKKDQLIETVKKNLEESKSGKAKKNTQGKKYSAVEVTSKKSIIIVVSHEFIKEKMKDLGTLNQIITDWDRPTIRGFFYSMYIKLKEKKISKIKEKNPKYDDILEYYSINDMILIPIIGNVKEYKNTEDVLYYYYKNGGFKDKKKDKSDSEENNDDSDILLKITEGIKYKVDFKKLNRSFEVFKVKYPDFIKTVQQFHYPCVRAYYNGTTVKMLASCLAIYNTYTTFEIKCFTSTSSSIDIFNKLYSRGFGCLLNKTEIEQWHRSCIFNENSQIKLVKASTKKNSIQQSNPQYFGGLTLANPMFGCTKDLTYIDTVNDLQEEYKTLYGYSWSGNLSINLLQKIDEQGYLIPLNKALVMSSFLE